MPDDNNDKKVVDALDKSFTDLLALLKKKNAELERIKKESKDDVEALEHEIAELKTEYLKSEKENEAALADLQERLEKVIAKIQALTSTVPIHVGIFIRLAPEGRVLIEDNHKTRYEVALSPEINPDGLAEGSEVHYTVDPMSGKPIGVFSVHKVTRDEEIVKIKAVMDGHTALAIFPGDTLKIVNISRLIKGELEKGEEVYYDSKINFVTGRVPKTEEKIDLRHVQKKTWADIGGLKAQVQKVREVAELPLLHPELFERLGISAPRGILLSGPPGCGKTLIGRILANETQAFFLHISGPEVISSYVGESEARLRAIFEAALKNTPAIIFIDEIDAISVKRDEAEHGHEKRLVDQLLALMDGLTAMERVIIIGATNKPDLLDEALRRPGRFDREIVLSAPDRDGRLEILKIHSKNMPLDSDVSLDSLADMTHGFTGADLEGLCKEAAMMVVRGINIDNVDSLLKQSKPMKVDANHFQTAFNGMKPSAMREITFLKPPETWADVGGLEDIKQKLVEAVQWGLRHPALLQRAGYKPPRGIMIYGPPGCGKTLLAKALAHECGVNFIPIKGPELLNKYVGESESRVRSLFKRARQSAPCIVFFDEIDALVSMRGANTGDAGVSDKVTAQLLTEFDGIESMEGVFILAATNRIDLVDPALLRSGRFDYTMYLPPPGKEARLKIFEIHTKKKPLAGDVNLHNLVEKTEPVLLGEEKLPSGDVIRAMMYFTGADIENICQKATQNAIREFLVSNDPDKDLDKFLIYMKHFEDVLKDMTPSVRAPTQNDANLPNRGTKAPVEPKRITQEDLDKLV